MERGKVDLFVARLLPLTFFFRDSYMYKRSGSAPFIKLSEKHLPTQFRVMTDVFSVLSMQVISILL